MCAHNWCEVDSIELAHVETVPQFLCQGHRLVIIPAIANCNVQRSPAYMFGHKFHHALYVMFPGAWFRLGNYCAMTRWNADDGLHLEH